MVTCLPKNILDAGICITLCVELGCLSYHESQKSSQADCARLLNITAQQCAGGILNRVVAMCVWAENNKAEGECFRAGVLNF